MQTRLKSTNLQEEHLTSSPLPQHPTIHSQRSGKESGHRHWRLPFSVLTDLFDDHTSHCMCLSLLIGEMGTTILSCHTMFFLSYNTRKHLESFTEKYRNKVLIHNSSCETNREGLNLSIQPGKFSPGRGLVQTSTYSLTKIVAFWVMPNSSWLCYIFHWFLRTVWM